MLQQIENKKIEKSSSKSIHYKVVPWTTTKKATTLHQSYLKTVQICSQSIQTDVFDLNRILFK